MAQLPDDDRAAVNVQRRDEVPLMERLRRFQAEQPAEERIMNRAILFALASCFLIFRNLSRNRGAQTSGDVPEDIPRVSRISKPEILERLNAPAKMRLATALPWPYNGMVADITSAIETGCNYLVALGLCCYTEVCGRELVFAGDTSKKDWEYFNAFIEYMGAGELLEKEIIFKGERIHFKDAVRNGLAHRYFMKVDSSMVAMIATALNDHEANRLGFWIHEGSVTLIAVPFFELFCGGLRRALAEGRLRQP